MADTLMQNQRRRTLTDKMVAALPKKQKRYTKPDPEQGGHYVRVMPDGANVFVAVARDPHGKQVWHTIGSADVLQIAEARERARTAIRRIKDGLPPVEAPPVKPDSVKAVAESWLQRHVAKKKLRTEDEIKRCLNKYVYDQWADHNFINIKAQRHHHPARPHRRRSRQPPSRPRVGDIALHRKLVCQPR